MSKDNDREELNKHLNDVKDNFKALTQSIFNLTGESFSELNEMARDMSLGWLLEDENANNSAVTKFDNRVLSNETWQYPSVYESHADRFRKHFSFFDHGHDHHHRHGPFASFYPYRVFARYGLVNRGTPSIRSYNECRDKNGEQLYDTYGNWRCLFPNSEILNELLNVKNQRYPNEILTKEDFQEELQTRQLDSSLKEFNLGDKGVFFKQYEDFMNWKSIMYKNARDERCRLRRKVKEEFRQKELAHDANLEVVNTEAVPLAEKKVISTNVESSYVTDDSNSVTFQETKTEYYDDGTSYTAKTVKTKAPGAKDWEVVENLNEHDTKSKGWFWN